MRKAGTSHGVLCRACVDQRKKREYGRLGAFTDDQSQAIRQLFDGDALLERSDILAESQSGKEQDRDGAFK
jgi:hypothetical protein